MTGVYLVNRFPGFFYFHQTMSNAQVTATQITAISMVRCQWALNTFYLMTR